MLALLDYVLKNGTVIDGTGRAGFRADVAVRDGTIAGIGQFDAAQARVCVDAAGKAVTPGFIDIHRHADAAAFRPGFGRAELRQGLTTIVNGNCGLSVAPCGEAYRTQILHYLDPVTGALPQAVGVQSMGEYLTALEKQPLPLNLGMLAGGGTLRASAAGFGSAVLTPEAMKTLHLRLEQALSDGALGVSLGLGYAPECFYTTDELIEALRPLAGSDVVVTVHMRQEGDRVVESLREMLHVAGTLRVPLEVSHLKSIGKRNWGRCTPEMLRLLENARQAGLDAACDMYPYTRGSTQLLHILPPECQNAPLEQLSQELLDPAYRAQVRRRMEQDSDFENISLLCGWENVYVTSAAKERNAWLLGMSVAQAASRAGRDPFDLVFDLLSDENCTPSMIDAVASDDDLERVLACPFSSVISDSTYPDTGLLHPRVYGSFVRMIETYVNRKKLLPLEQAVRKMTSLPASRLRLTGRGILQPGADADLCVFDPLALHECGTYTDPAREAAGMDYVFVGGRPAIARGEWTKERAGRVLRR